MGSICFQRSIVFTLIKMICYHTEDLWQLYKMAVYNLLDGMMYDESIL